MLLALKIENRRFWKVHHSRDTPAEDKYAKVNLIIPCKGIDDDAGVRLSSFFAQDHPNFRITFAVESATDQVVPLIRELQAANENVESSIVAAGRAVHCSQKVHNLIAAVDKLQKQIDIIAFADADVAVDSAWLRWLTIGVGRENIGARTGYRWMIPLDRKIPTLIGVNLNNSVATCLGKGSHNLVWGGSWAIHRRVFEQTGIREAWQQVLSDDLVASKVLQRSMFQGRRLKIQFEPQCLCNTEIAFTWRTLSEFIVRQLKITRLYLPRRWSLALFNSVTSQVAFWGGVIAWCLVMASGDRGVLPTTLLFSIIGIYVMGMARASIRQSMARRVVSGWRKFKRARRMDLFAWPVSGAFALWALAQSAFGSRITWSNIHYRMDRGGRTMIEGRNIVGTDWPVDTSVTATDSGQECSVPIHGPVEPDDASVQEPASIQLKRSA